MAVSWELKEKNIWQDKENPKRFKVALYYGRDARGRMKKSSKVIEGTITDARKLLKLHEADRIKEVQSKPSKKTLKEVFDDWNYKGDGAQTEETTKMSNGNLQRHMIEYFGDIRISKITTAQIREYLAFLKEEKNLSNLTVNKHRTHLNTIFNYILTVPEEYGIYNNPVKNIKPYKVQKVQFQVYEPEEAKELLLSLHHSGRHDLETAVNVAFWCGCRREEICALKWKSVDLKNDTITICEVRTTAKGKVIERDSTKNGVIRKIGITPWFHMILENEWNHQAEMKKELGSEYKENGFVFCHDDGSPWHPNSLSNEFHKYLEKNGLKVIRLHDLRHTNLSLLMTKMGAVEVAKLGGHKKASTTTDIYGHSFNNTVETGAHIIDEIINMDNN